MTDRRRGVDDAAGRFEHLGEALGATDQAATVGDHPGVGTTDRGGEFVGARAQAGVDRGVDVVAELEVDEDTGGRQHQGDHRGEDEGEAEADREAAQRPPSFRSR